MSELEPTGGEQEKTIERTKESEIKANVDFWQGLGVEVDTEDVQKEIEAVPEVPGFSFYLYMPEGIKFSDVWRKIYAGTQHQESKRNFDEVLEMPRTAENSYAVAAHFSQTPDKDSLGENAKSAEDWEKTDEKFMTPLERLVAGMRWSQEKGTDMDPIETQFNFDLDELKEGAQLFNNVGTYTLCPGSYWKDETWGKIPSVPLVYHQNRHNLPVSIKHSAAQNAVHPFFGVRRVITTDTPEEVLTKYRQDSESFR